MSTPSTPVLICTGFHRSATSVTAQWLSRAGLPMWLWEMGAQPSNPAGHFEDWTAVGLHDALLARQGLDWQFTDGEPWFPEAGVEQIRRYVVRRYVHAGCEPWGMKDPRACLFLPAWHEVLGEKGRYLFVLRHWAGCVDSLLRRHSAAIAAQQVPGRQDLAFWEQPLLAARMWLAYNRRLLAFAQAHKDQVLLVTQKSLFDGVDLPALARDQLDVPLQPACSPVQRALLTEQVDGHVAQLIPEGLQTALNRLWQELLEACKYKTDDEAVSWRAPSEAALPDWAVSALRKPSVCSADQAGQAPPHDLATRLEAVLTFGGKSANLASMFEAIEQQARFDTALWERLARVALRNAGWEVAERALERVLAFGESEPHHLMMMGDVREGVGDERAAEVLYQQARERNPQDEQSHLRLARLYMRLGRHVEAETVLLEGWTYFDSAPASLLSLWCDCLEQQGRRAEAVDWLRNQVTLSPGLHTKLAVMEIAEGLVGGEDRLRRLETAWLSRLDLHSLLEKALCNVQDRSAREDLARRLCKVWDLPHSCGHI